MEKSGRGWGKAARLQFIEFRLYWEGRINRGDLVEHFEISVPQASLDLRSYLELAPGNMDYDKQRKAYFATDNFKPALIAPSANDYLSQLVTLQAERDSPFSHRSFVGMPPAFDIAATPDRVVNPETFRRVLQAIRDHKAIEMEYQSMSRPEPLWRWMAPHAIASDGFRWHIRAYCFENAKFLDFVFGRILALRSSRESEIDPSQDAQWNSLIELTIGANPALPDAKKRVIELDYGMRNGTALLIIREALTQYMKKQLGLIANISGKEVPPEECHIRLIGERRLPTDIAVTT